MIEIARHKIDTSKTLLLFVDFKYILDIELIVHKSIKHNYSTSRITLTYVYIINHVDFFKIYLFIIIRMFKHVD